MIKEWLRSRKNKKLRDSILAELSRLEGRTRLDKALRYANKYPELDIPTSPYWVMYGGRNVE